ncbi:hypothetical protein C8Q77DRAFT_1092766 [Trametes polyzona]|nr:hypothetical protein C8Q77DRAFT_1092766 [Trametes polyzona]
MPADCEGGAGEGQAAAPVRARDDQHPGPGPGTLEAQVCLLDSRAPPGGQGGREGPLGRADSARGSELLGAVAVDQVGLAGLPYQYYESAALDPPLYDRCREEALGAEDAEMSEGGEEEDVPRCFNCGEPGHIVSDCDQQIDRALIALSRQMFNFYRGSSGGPTRRIHEVALWQEQRLRWLDEFEPGEIRGALLRDALGLRDDNPGEEVPWLRRMARWGYPPGWVGSHDPRERVWERITQSGAEPEDDCDFKIVADGEEQVSLRPMNDIAHDPTPNEAPSASPTAEHRWAKYPGSYFLWDRLPIYRPTPDTLISEWEDRMYSVANDMATMGLRAPWQGLNPAYSAAAAKYYGHVPPQSAYYARYADAPPPEPNAPPPPMPPPPSSTPPPLPPSLSPESTPPSVRVSSVPSFMPQLASPPRSPEQRRADISEHADDEDMDLSD